MNLIFIVAEKSRQYLQTNQFKFCSKVLGLMDQFVIVFKKFLIISTVIKPTSPMKTKHS